MNDMLVPPDPFRLKYRRELTTAVAAIVRGGQAADEAAVRAVLPATVAEEDRARFVTLTLAEFKTIHPGNAIRFGLRPLEFSAWLERETGRG
jgi:hypothetical protein